MSDNTWSWFQSGPGEPGWNMAMDATLLEQGSRWTQPILRFYGWTQAAASFGYFQRYAEIARTTTLRPLIRRPTAGGLVPHDADWTYSLLFPSSHSWYALRAEESYQRLHEWVKESLQDWASDVVLSPCCAKTQPGQCFAGPEKHDLVWNSHKVAGAAQRRTREALLIQGSIQGLPSHIARSDWERSFLNAATRAWGVTWTGFQPGGTWEASVEKSHRDRYGLASFHEHR